MKTYLDDTEIKKAIISYLFRTLGKEVKEDAIKLVTPESKEYDIDEVSAEIDLSKI